VRSWLTWLPASPDAQLWGRGELEPGALASPGSAAGSGGTRGLQCRKRSHNHLNRKNNFQIWLRTRFNNAYNFNVN